MTYFDNYMDDAVSKKPFHVVFDNYCDCIM